MSINDYKGIEEFKKGNIKISIKSLTKLVNCKKENRGVCNGFCCRRHNETLLPEYDAEEIAKLPKELKEFIRVDRKVFYKENGDCMMLPYCNKDGSLRPLQCKLSPLGFNKQSRLIIKRWVWLKPCPFYGKGTKPIYITMKDCLIDCFGQEIYDKIVEMIISGVEEEKIQDKAFIKKKVLMIHREAGKRYGKKFVNENLKKG